MTYGWVDIIHRQLQLSNLSLTLVLVQCVQAVGVFNEAAAQVFLDSSAHTAHAVGDLTEESGSQRSDFEL